MGAKLYVGNLPFAADENAVREFFAKAGGVESVKIVTDPYNGRSKGFGFVEMEDESGAAAAIEQLNGADMMGRPLRVDRARPRDPRRAPGSPMGERGEQ